MAIKQISVFVENKQGKLAETVRLISEAGLNIRAMSIADTKEFGILRLILPDIDKAIEVIGEASIVKVTDVVCVRMNDEVGALSSILTVLGNADINVDYMYAFTAPTDFGAYVVLRVDDVMAAEKALAEGGITPVGADVISKL